MNTINNALINAILADASYVNDLTHDMNPQQLQSLLKPRMTPTLDNQMGTEPNCFVLAA